MAQLGLEPGTCILGQALSPRATYRPSALCQALAEGSCDLLAGLNPSAVTMLPFHYLRGGRGTVSILALSDPVAGGGDPCSLGRCCPSWRMLLLFRHLEQLP